MLTLSLVCSSLPWALQGPFGPLCPEPWPGLGTVRGKRVPKDRGRAAAQGSRGNKSQSACANPTNPPLVAHPDAQNLVPCAKRAPSALAEGGRTASTSFLPASCWQAGPCEALCAVPCGVGVMQGKSEASFADK